MEVDIYWMFDLSICNAWVVALVSNAGCNGHQLVGRRSGRQWSSERGEGATGPHLLHGEEQELHWYDADDSVLLVDTNVELPKAITR